MAEFDDNPFADPANINPFADPSVQAATGTPKTEEEYNPFADEPKQKDPEPIKLPPPPKKSEVKAKEKKEKKKTKTQPPKKIIESEPAIMEPDEPPSYTPAPSSFRDNDDLRKREEEISRRESALQDREKNIERLGSGDAPKNFPPFPKFCPSPFKPCFYINVKVEVPPSEHWKMYSLLALMIYLWILLIVNLIVAIVGAATANLTVPPLNQGDYLTTMGVAVVYLVLFLPGSFFCWFLPVYFAYKKDSSLAFMWFFFVMLFQCLGFVLNAIGIPKMGAVGFFNGAYLFNGAVPSPTAAGAMYMIVGVAWLIGIIPAIFLLIMIHKYYRSSGGSINKAVTEGVQGAAKNEAVKGAVKSTMKAGVKTAFSDQ